MTFLKSIRTLQEKIDPNRYPFTIPAFSQGINLEFTRNVTLFVGENGTGKSTLLEAIACGCGFNLAGGNRNHTYGLEEGEPVLFDALRFAWMPKVTQGFFLRAESFYNFASYIDQLAAEDPDILNAYGGRSLHEQSHGESFLALFTNRFQRGIYILDEPEAALSPQRQLAFLALIHRLDQAGKAQFIIATHSPILLGYPGASLLSLDGDSIQAVEWKETSHYQTMKAFLEAPERYFKYLFEDEG